MIYTQNYDVRNCTPPHPFQTVHHSNDLFSSYTAVSYCYNICHRNDTKNGITHSCVHLSSRPRTYQGCAVVIKKKSTHPQIPVMRISLLYFIRFGFFSIYYYIGTCSAIERDYIFVMLSRSFLKRWRKSFTHYLHATRLLWRRERPLSSLSHLKLNPLSPPPTVFTSPSPSDHDRRKSISHVSFARAKQ